MRILLVKTSSLGDVIHNLPVVSDLRGHFPDASIDWVVEEGFADIPRLHTDVRQVIPVAVRRWRKTLLTKATWRQLTEFRRQLQAETYDLVIDTQGLLKSALIVRQARGRHCGFDSMSAREPMAARFYDDTFSVPTSLHAVVRNRRLVALAAGYDLAGAPNYGIAGSVAVQSAPTFAVLLTATSRDDKLWPEEHWIALGRTLSEHGIACQLPAGNAVERERAARLAQAIPGATSLPPLSLAELATTLSAARLVLGVDTGLVHLAAALGRPTLALFRASDPALTGVLAGPEAINLGSRGMPPTVADVVTAARPWL